MTEFCTRYVIRLDSPSDRRGAFVLPVSAELTHADISRLRKIFSLDRTAMTERDNFTNKTQAALIAMKRHANQLQMSHLTLDLQPNPRMHEKGPSRKITFSIIANKNHISYAQDFVQEQATTAKLDLVQPTQLRARIFQNTIIRNEGWLELDHGIFFSASTLMFCRMSQFFGLRYLETAPAPGAPNRSLFMRTVESDRPTPPVIPFPR